MLQINNINIKLILTYNVYSLLYFNDVNPKAIYPIIPRAKKITIIKIKSLTLSSPPMFFYIISKIVLKCKVIPFTF